MATAEVVRKLALVRRDTNEYWTGGMGSRVAYMWSPNLQSAQLYSNTSPIKTVLNQMKRTLDKLGSFSGWQSTVNRNIVGLIPFHRRNFKVVSVEIVDTGREVAF